MQVIKSVFRMSIFARIWLSIGIFILGFVFSIALAQVQGIKTEQQLNATSEGLFPDTLKVQRVFPKFDGATKGIAEAMVLHDSAELEQAVEEGRKAADVLRGVAANGGLPGEHSIEAKGIAAEIDQILTAEGAVFRTITSSTHGPSPETQATLQELENRTATVKVALHHLERNLAQTLQESLSALQTRSANVRWLGLLVFAATLLVSALVVNVTIHRVISRPLQRAEAQLARERDLLRILLDNIPDTIYFKDVESRFTRINKAQCRLIGVDDESHAIGKTDLDFFDGAHAQEAFADEREIVRTGLAQVSKVERVSGTGVDRRWMTSTKVPIKDEAGQVVGLVGVSRDVTDWQLAVEALEKSEESFRLLFGAIPHAVWVYDVETLEFLEFNHEAIQHYGYSAEEFRGLTISDVHPPEEAARLKQFLTSLDQAKPPSGAWKLWTKDKRILDVEVSARVLDFRGRLAVLAVSEDVTERKRLEVELRQSQRLESVGQLAAGIAHEINTPIQYVGDNLRFIADAFADRQKALAMYETLRQAVEAGNVPQSLRLELAEFIESADLEYLSQEIPKALAQSLDGVDRVATIVRAMKEFAHPGETEAVAADLNRALANALVVSKNEIKYVADVVTELGDLPLVVCRIGEINQVFLNLLINASHAIAEVTRGTQNKGKITVRTRRVGDQAVVTISDTGCGISDAIRSKVYDPFFTTKEVGRGTGQGLSISRSIVVDKHGGSLTFEANEVQGTTFTVAIPIDAAAGSHKDEAECDLGDVHETHPVC